MQTGAIVAIQDMGAAGLTCSTCEMGARGRVGIEIELDRVPQRETGMTPYEILLSESQERMLLVAARGREEEVRRIFAKWELEAVEIGRVTEGGELTARLNGEVVASVPVDLLAEAPKYRKLTAEPAELAERRGVRPLTFPEASGYRGRVVGLLRSPTIPAQEGGFSQYDQQVGVNTPILPGFDAAVLP